ncbi:hypothetical protein PV08_02364 [Exophiala spinifera]|uniref:Uncharacterized protein n=1 Tax=Exophiala spinifera TaxID=91928 RepID=A0A0D1ZZG0_9EURO|nr:uncharacterized protein PV08_02364 [Exophiala spinifera]KIW18077.1 hypothetical protein PV08_02364 [Exophiala spinifera]
MISASFIFLVVLTYSQTAYSNVEKVIFTSSLAEPYPTDASFANLLLVPLSEERPTVRTELDVSFPNSSARDGQVHWFFLEGLRPQQRYEVRICWPATQPTAFSLATFPVDAVLSDSSLLLSVSDYAYGRHEKLSAGDMESLQQRKTAVRPDTTILFLQILAAADYFSLNDTLMTAPPPVIVDIILDRYIWNVFPESLIPTALYLVLIAAFAWLFSGWMAKACTAPFIQLSAAKKSE